MSSPGVGSAPRAKPGYAVDEPQALILRLLVDGATVARTAWRPARASELTVSAQVHKLIAKTLGSRSRVRLGCLIAFHGLIAFPQPDPRC